MKNILLVITFITSFVGLLLFVEKDLSSFFSQIDFIEYYTSFQLFLNHKNPYDAQALLVLQKEIGINSLTPLMMWNPPWLFLILGPVLSLPYSLACLVWFSMNILFVVASIRLTTKIEDLNLPRNKVPLVCSLVIFYPMISCLLMGQLGCFLTFILTCLYYALRKERDFLAGFCWFVLSIKPHLFIFLTVFLMAYLVKSRRHTILLSAIILLIINSILVYIINPLALNAWVDAQINGVNLPLVPTVTQHKTTTIVYALRSLLYRLSLGVQNWPFFAVPLIPLVLYLPYLIRKSVPNLLTFEQFFLAITLSFLFCPFGWIFDFVALILIYFVLIVRRINLRGNFSIKDPVVLGLILLNLICFYLDANPAVGLHHFVFFAWGVWILSYFSALVIKTE